MNIWVGTKIVLFLRKKGENHRKMTFSFLEAWHAVLVCDFLNKFHPWGWPTIWRLVCDFFKAEEPSEPLCDLVDPLVTLDAGELLRSPWEAVDIDGITPPDEWPLVLDVVDVGDAEPLSFVVEEWRLLTLICDGREKMVHMMNNISSKLLSFLRQFDTVFSTWHSKIYYITYMCMEIGNILIFERLIILRWVMFFGESTTLHHDYVKNSFRA